MLKFANRSHLVLIYFYNSDACIRVNSKMLQVVHQENITIISDANKVLFFALEDANSIKALFRPQSGITRWFDRPILGRNQFQILLAIY